MKRLPDGFLLNGFLLDTNVISEWVKPMPNTGVIRWLAEADNDEVYLSVVAIAEIRRGVERMAKGRRRDKIAAWLGEDLLPRFEGRVLAVDTAVSQEWGVVVEQARNGGMTIGVMDAFLAATARHWGLTLVTRNTADFQGLGVPVFDPWAE